MASYKYGDTFSTSHSCRTFDEFVEYRFRLNTAQCPKVTLEKDGRVSYYPDEIVIGEEYFVGKQRTYWNETREDFPYGVYKLIGKEFETLWFESKGGRKIEVRCGTVVLKKIRIIEAQAKYGFYFPSYIKAAWPDLQEYTENMPKPEYDFGIKPGIRNHIDAVLALVIWVLGIVFLSTVKGGEFSFNFAGSVAYYSWILFGGIFVLGKFFTRERK